MKTIPLETSKNWLQLKLVPGPIKLSWKSGTPFSRITSNWQIMKSTTAWILSSTINKKEDICPYLQNNNLLFSVRIFLFILSKNEYFFSKQTGKKLRLSNKLISRFLFIFFQKKTLNSFHFTSFYTFTFCKKKFWTNSIQHNNYVTPSL